MRTGIGYDIHKLEEGRKLILGGVKIPYSKGLSSYSDGDVLSHAVCDALLGAAGLGDIGEHFPDTDPAFKGVSSIELVKKVKRMLDERGFFIVNIDTVIMAEQPKLSSFKLKIKTSIAEVLNIEVDKINIKAGTAEGFGAVGRGEAISAFVAVMVDKL